MVNPYTTRPINVLSILAVVAALSLGLGGCTMKNPTSSSALSNGDTKPTEMQVYIPGTVFVYASGRWDRVEQVNGDKVSWVNHNGHPMTTSSDFTYRPAIWKSATHEGTRTFEPAEFLFSTKTPSLWPLSVGKESGYYEVNRWHEFNLPYQTYRAYWACEVEGEATVTVPAGKFDTLKVVCSRYSGRTASVPAYPREYRTWYYTKEIQHWVAYERNYLGENRKLSRKRLAAVIPSLFRPGISENDRNKIGKFFQYSLNSMEDGGTSVWRSDATSLEMKVSPRKTFKRNSNTSCRQYEQILVIDGKEEKYFGIACRSQPQDKWEVPMR